MHVHTSLGADLTCTFCCFCIAAVKSIAYSAAPELSGASKTAVLLAHIAVSELPCAHAATTVLMHHM